MSQPRRPWYLLTGLMLGLVIGLGVAWGVAPVQYSDAAPALLRPVDKAQYRSLIAQAFVADGDAGRAKQRLSLLEDANPAQEVAAQAQRVLAEGGSLEEAQALAQLAAALTGQASSNPAPGAENPDHPAVENHPTPFETVDISQAVFTATPQAKKTSTPLPSFTPRATLVVPTLGAPLKVQKSEKVCQADWMPALLQVQVQNASGEGLAGVKITVSWDGGQDTFYTGFYPEISPGYADFEMTPGIVYQVQAGDGGEEAGEISAAECPAEGDAPSFSGGWRVVFVQP